MTEADSEVTREDRIRSWVEGHRREIEKHLMNLVEMETPSEEPRMFEVFFEEFAADLESAGLETERVEGDDTGGRLEGWTNGGVEGEVQLLLGHADTVWPLGTVPERPPEIQDGVLEGPGALDMKAGLTQMVFALKALDELDLQPPIPVYVLVSSDEEVGSPESKPRILDLAERSNRVFVLEPASGPEGKIKTARKAVGHFTVEIQGEAAHAGIEPEEGASATEELGSVIGRLHPLSNVEAGVTVNVGEVEAGLRSNVVAPRARAEVDVRAPTEEAADAVEREIRGLEAETEGTEVEIHGGFGRPPMERTPDNRLLWRRVKEVGDRIGLQLDDVRSGGASDGNDASQHAATIDGFGAVGDGAHQEYEYVDLDRMEDRVTLLAASLLEEPLPEQPADELQGVDRAEGSA